MKVAKERIFQHRVTSLIGFVILLLTGYYFFIKIYSDKLTFETIGIGFVLGFVGVFFLAAKDTWFNKIFRILSGKLDK